MAGSRRASEEKCRVSRATTEEPEGWGALAIERDGQGRPLAFRELAGSAPGFDLGIVRPAANAATRCWQCD
jgi:hypothetical protein